MNKMLRFRYADIQAAEDCRKRLESLNYLAKITAADWKGMGLALNANFANHGQLSNYFKDVHASMKAAIDAERSRLCEQLAAIGVELAKDK